MKNHEATNVPNRHSMLGQYQPASETPFKWRFAGAPMMAHFKWYLDPFFSLINLVFIPKVEY